MANTGRAQVLPWGTLGNWRLAPAPRAWPLALVPQQACLSLLHASSGSFPCEPRHVTGPAGMRGGGGVRADEESRLPTQHHEQLTLEGSRGLLCGRSWCPAQCVLRQKGKDSGLRWERLRTVNKKDRGHVLAVQQKQPLRGQEGETEGQGESTSFMSLFGSPLFLP